MVSKRDNKCRICGDLFTGDPRNRKLQRYCPKSACKAAGKAARQRRWHRGQAQRALQDALNGQLVDLTGVIGGSVETALQDALRCQGPVLIGLVAHLSDSALQADIAATSRRLLQLGQDILGGKRRDAHQTGAAT